MGCKDIGIRKSKFVAKTEFSVSCTSVQLWNVDSFWLQRYIGLVRISRMEWIITFLLLSLIVQVFNINLWLKLMSNNSIDEYRLVKMSKDEKGWVRMSKDE